MLVRRTFYKLKEDLSSVLGENFSMQEKKDVVYSDIIYTGKTCELTFTETPVNYKNRLYIQFLNINFSVTLVGFNIRILYKEGFIYLRKNFLELIKRVLFKYYLNPPKDPNDTHRLIFSEEEI